MRIFFRFPEILLILAILVPPVVIANTAFDIQLHDTYIVFSKTSWGFNSLFIALEIFTLISWVAHLLARKYKWLPRQWRWTQVVLTLIILTAMVSIMSNRLLWAGDESSFVGYNPPAYEMLQKLEHQLTWSILLFLLTQVVFWVVVIIAFIISLVRRRRTANN
jgi:hypothetical protein